MRTLSCRRPLVGALAAILVLAGIARAQMPEPGLQPTSNLGQMPGEFHPQSLNTLAEPTDGGGYPLGTLYGNGQPSDTYNDWSVSIFYAYEGFRGTSDGAWENNGVNTGFNFGTRLGRFSDATGIGFQIGGSIGIYDWSGTDYRFQNMEQAETEGFFTMGFFRKAQPESPWNAGLVFDWMLNNNFSVFNESPTLNQFRYQVGYDVNDTNEIGVWGTVHGQSSTRDVPSFGPVTWRSMDQINAYVHHKWPLGADTYVWVGAPLGSRLADGASLGSFIAAARGDMPLSDWISLYSVVTYMRPAVGPGELGANQDEWSFAVGLAIYPRRDARTPTVAREGWSPLLPVASNGTFFVDASNNF